MIPLFKPSCSDLEIRNVAEVLRSGWWGGGSKVAELEEQFAARVGVKYAVATNNCTAALQIALEALDMRGWNVIMPALTFAATGLSALHSGARVVFADIDEDTLCINWADVQGKLSSQVKAIIPVWYGGMIPPVTSYCDHFPAIIEDCAHATGNPHAGHNGTAACWSFNAVKNLASGDGGMITTNDEWLASRVRRLRRFGIDKQGSWDYEIPVAGFKADMNDITAAIALAQLQRLDEMNELRRKIALTYMKELRYIPWLQLPQWDENSSWNMFVVRISEGRDGFIEHMLSHGVSAGVHYKPLDQHGIFGGKQHLPVTDRVWKTLVTLPLYPDMTEGEIEKVIETAEHWGQPCAC